MQQHTASCAEGKGGRHPELPLSPEKGQEVQVFQDRAGLRAGKGGAGTERPRVGEFSVHLEGKDGEVLETHRKELIRELAETTGASAVCQQKENFDHFDSPVVGG